MNTLSARVGTTGAKSSYVSIAERQPLTNIPPLIPWSNRVDHSLKPKINEFDESYETQHPMEWKPTLLRIYILILTMLATLVLAVTIIALLVFSTKNRGISTVNLGDQKTLFGSTTLALRISLTWTFIPVLIFQLYILLIDAIVKAAGARQPYVELNKGAPAEKTICLDYTAGHAMKNPWTALKLKHFTLAYGFTLMVLVSVILTALAAHLLDRSDIETIRPHKVKQTLEFSTGSGSLNARSDLISMLDIVAATKVYGGQPIAWTTLNESILPAELNGVPKTSNFTMKATAYSVGIDCRVLDGPDEFLLEQTENGWEFETADRGCDYHGSEFISSIALYVRDYIHTYSTQSCPGADPSRIIVVAALNANNSESVLTNKTAVSCSMAYYSTTGLLSLSIDPSKPEEPTINDFVPEKSIQLLPRPTFAFPLELEIQNGQVLDPTNTVQGSPFGHVILQYAQKLSPKSYFDGSVLKRATEEVYTTAFAVTANQFLLEPTVVDHVSGHVHGVETRLVVVPVVAYLVIIILAAVEIMLIWICLYTQSNNSILYEEPKGLLGAAVILRNSYLMGLVEDIGFRSYDGKVATALSKGDATGETWIYTDWQTPSSAKLMISKVLGMAH